MHARGDFFFILLYGQIHNIFLKAKGGGVGLPIWMYDRVRVESASQSANARLFVYKKQVYKKLRLRFRDFNS